MTIELNHTIVPARDKVASAKFFAKMFGLPFDESAFSLLFLTQEPSRLRKNSIYTQHAVGIFHMAPIPKQVQDAQTGLFCLSGSETLFGFLGEDL